MLGRGDSRKTCRACRRRLGLLGERAVGEELNHLMRQGAYVFHDVPTASYGNADHVVIAPKGNLRHRNEDSAQTRGSGQ